jgi:hypothetical protein
MSTTEELLESKSSGSVQENRYYGHRGSYLKGKVVAPFKKSDITAIGDLLR